MRETITEEACQNKLDVDFKGINKWKEEISLKLDLLNNNEGLTYDFLDANSQKLLIEGNSMVTALENCKCNALDN